MCYASYSFHMVGSHISFPVKYYFKKSLGGLSDQGKVRSGQVRSGQVRLGLVLLKPCED